MLGIDLSPAPRGWDVAYTPVILDPAPGWARHEIVGHAAGIPTGTYLTSGAARYIDPRAPRAMVIVRNGDDPEEERFELVRHIDDEDPMWRVYEAVGERYSRLDKVVRQYGDGLLTAEEMVFEGTFIVTAYLSRRLAGDLCPAQ